MNHAGRESASSPAESVSGSGSPAVQSGPVPVSGTRYRSTTPNATRKNATASPFGDHTGLNEFSSWVTRSSSAPVFASRMTTSVPKVLVLVAATNLPSRDQEGAV